MPRTPIARPVGAGFCTHNKGAGKRCGRETDWKPDGTTRYSECPVHRERGMEKSRRRREAAGKIPRRRREPTPPPPPPHPGTDDETQGTTISHDRLPWALHVLQTASIHPSPTHLQAAAAAAAAAAGCQHPLANPVNSDHQLHTQIHPRIQPHLHSSLPSTHSATAAATHTAQGGNPDSLSQTQSSTTTAHSHPPPSILSPLPDRATATDTTNPHPEPEPYLSTPPLTSLDFPAPSPHAAPSHPTLTTTAPRCATSPSSLETETRAAMWETHRTTLSTLKDDLDSLLATLWARDADPRALDGMFVRLREEVERTREESIGCLEP